MSQTYQGLLTLHVAVFQLDFVGLTGTAPSQQVQFQLDFVKPALSDPVAAFQLDLFQLDFV